MFAAIVVAAAGISVGIGTLAIVRDSPGGSLAGTSTLGAVALLSAGWLAIAVGLGTWRRRPGTRVGALLVAAGFAWFVTEWNNPGVNSSVVFTIGLLGYAACPPLVAHAALSYPGGRVGSAAEKAALAAAYAGSFGVIGLGRGLVFEPADQDCAQCAANLVTIASDAGLVDSLDRVGVWLGAAWAASLGVLALWRLARSTPATRRAGLPVLVPVVAYLGAVAATYVHALDRGFMSNDALDHHLWLVQAAALVAVAVGLVAAWIRSRRARSAVAGIVAELAGAPPTGGLRDALAGALGDPELELAYPIGDGRYVDSLGSPISAEAIAGRATTALVSDDGTVAVVIHRSDLLGDRRLVEEAVSAARLAFENERLHAEASAQLAELSDSRARLVAAADAERRRLERDLHDGAQQRLVALTLATRMLRTQLEQEGSTELAGQVAEAETELRQAVDDVRELAAGIHPAVLSDFGLAAAVRALAERGSGRVKLVDVTDERFPPAAETTAYLLVAEAAKMGAVSVSARRCGAALLVEIDADGQPPRLVDLEDRVSALDGTMTTEPIAAGVQIRVMIPCE